MLRSIARIPMNPRMERLGSRSGAKGGAPLMRFSRRLPAGPVQNSLHVQEKAEAPDQDLDKQNPAVSQRKPRPSGCSLVKSVPPATAASGTMDPIQVEKVPFGCRSWESQLRFDCRRGQPDCIGPAPELRGGENAKREYCCSKVQPDESSVCVRR